MIFYKFLNKYLDDISKLHIIILLLVIIFLEIIIYLKYGFSIYTCKYYIFIPFMMIISIIDYYTMYVYDEIIFSAIFIQLILFFINVNIENSYIITFTITFFISYLLYKITKSIGEGDVYFYLFCSFLIEYNYIIHFLFLPFLISLPYCIYNLKNRNTKIPFTPFISLSTLAILIF